MQGFTYNASKGTLPARADKRRECRPYGDRARGNAPANFAFKQNVSFCFLGSPTYADQKFICVSAVPPTASKFPHNVWSDKFGEGFSLRFLAKKPFMDIAFYAHVML